MKILLIGEYSGFHNSLKDGLNVLGHSVTLAARGDTFKKIERDIIWDVEVKSPIKKVLAHFHQIKDVLQLKNFDVVQFIGPAEFNPRFGYNSFLMNKLLNNNTKGFLVVAADDCVVWNYFKNPTISDSFEYNWVRDIIKFKSQELQVMKWCENDQFQLSQSKLTSRMKGVIPIAYEYYKPYEKYHNIQPIIRMPINTDKVKYEPNKLNGKLVVFHGLNREAAKGTPYVRKAFEILSKKYPNDLELVIDGQMPLNTYLDFIKRVNVVVDQTSSYSIAMNALYSMAMGKVVLGGAEPASINALGYETMPVLNIKPDPDQIVSQIEYVLDHKNNIEEMGLKSRQFVEKYHNYIDVAKQYESIYLK